VAMKEIYAKLIYYRNAFLHAGNRNPEIYAKMPKMHNA
jgi:hypothetical protein